MAAPSRRGCRTEAEECGMVLSEMPDGVGCHKDKPGMRSVDVTLDRRSFWTGPMGARLRAYNSEYEFVRMFIQLGLLTISATSLLSILLYPLVGSPFALPERFLDETFGPDAKKRLLHWEPLWMNRSRYEAPENMFHPIMFTKDSRVGQAQDASFDLWNWGVRQLYQGPFLMKLFSLAVTACVWTPGILFVLTLIKDIDVLAWVPRPVRNFYLRCLPEWLLVLEQLIVAHGIGRKLSSPSVAEVDAVIS